MDKGFGVSYCKEGQKKMVLWSQGKRKEGTLCVDMGDGGACFCINGNNLSEREKPVVGEGKGVQL